LSIVHRVKLTFVKFWWSLWIGPGACSRSLNISLYKCLGLWTKQHNADCIHDNSYFVKFTINSYISTHNWKYGWNLLKMYGIFMVFLSTFTNTCIALAMYNIPSPLLYCSDPQLLYWTTSLSCPNTSLIPSSSWQCGLLDWHMSGQGSRSCSCPPISHCPWIIYYITWYHTKKMY
jgi:hypothetical protein